MSQPETPEDKPDSSNQDTPGQSSSKKKWLGAGLVVIALLGIIGAALIYKSTTGTNEAKVNAALERLDLASRGVELDKQIGQVATSNLSKKKTLRRAKALRRQVTDLRTEASETDGAKDIVQGTDQAIRALDRVTRLAHGIRESKTIIVSTKKEDVGQLKINRTFLSRLANLNLGPLLASSLGSYQASIRESISDLEDEDSLPSQDSNKNNPEDSLTRIDELKKDLVKVDDSPAKQINQLIDTSKDQEYELLVTRAVADCGRTSEGKVVLLQAGEAICDDLIAMVEKVDGYGNGLYSAPDGWTCAARPVTPAGNVGPFASGFGCTDGAVEISVFLDENRLNQVDQEAAAPAEPECPPGKRFQSSPHLQECVVVEGAESE